MRVVSKSKNKQKVNKRKFQEDQQQIKLYVTKITAESTLSPRYNQAVVMAARLLKIESKKAEKKSMLSLHSFLSYHLSLCFLFSSFLFFLYIYVIGKAGTILTNSTVSIQVCGPALTKLFLAMTYDLESRESK